SSSSESGVTPSHPVRAEERAQLGPELLLVGRLGAQALEQDAAERAARRGEVVRDRGDVEAVLARELVVRGTRRSLAESVRAEERGAHGVTLQGERALELLQGRGEDAPAPLGVEPGLDRVRRDRLRARELALGRLEVEPEHRPRRRALRATARLLLVRDEAIEREPEEPAEAPAARIEARQPLPLERLCEEALRQILRVLVRFAEAQAHVLVD